MVEEKKEPVTTDLTTNWFTSVETFDQLEIKEDLLRGIFGNHFLFN